MGLRERIPEDIRSALRQKRSLELNVLRMLQASIKNREIESRGELNDEQVVQVISSEIKKRREAEQEYMKVSREDAAKLERLEIDILMKYMPEQLSEEEIVARCLEVISDVGAHGLRDMGAVMKSVMSRLKGKADGKLINHIVREELEKMERRLEETDE